MQDHTQALREALQGFLDFHTKPAGISVELITEKELFSQAMADIGKREEDLIAAARAALSNHEDGGRADTSELEQMRERKDAAYLERNQVVAALAKCFPSGVARTAIEGWSEDWHGCVYIDLPTGQASWHFHDSHAYLFDSLPPYTGTWDGHDTPEKYARLAKLGVALGGEPPCNPHPDAPHGYNRNASHNAGRYVCDCEGWAAMGGEKGEAVAWQWQTEDGQVGFIDPWQKESGWEQANPRAKLIRPLFAAPVGKARMLTDEEADHITGMHNTGRSQGDSECAEAIQRKFCEVNGIELQDVQRGSKTFPENNVSKD